MKKSASTKISAHERGVEDNDIPEVTDEQLARGVLRVGGQPVARGKVRVTMYLDAWIVELFKAKAGERGYQTLINEALAQHLLSQDLESLVRRVVREELQAAHTTAPTGR